MEDNTTNGYTSEDGSGNQKRNRENLGIISNSENKNSLRKPVGRVVPSRYMQASTSKNKIDKNIPIPTPTRIVSSGSSTTERNTSRLKNIHSSRSSGTTSSNELSGIIRKNSSSLSRKHSANNLKVSGNSTETNPALSRGLSTDNNSKSISNSNNLKNLGNQRRGSSENVLYGNSSLKDENTTTPTFARLPSYNYPISKLKLDNSDKPDGNKISTKTTILHDVDISVLKSGVHINSNNDSDSDFIKGSMEYLLWAMVYINSEKVYKSELEKIDKKLVITSKKLEAEYDVLNECSLKLNYLTNINVATDWLKIYKGFLTEIANSINNIKTKYTEIGFALEQSTSVLPITNILVPDEEMMITELEELSNAFKELFSDKQMKLYKIRELARRVNIYKQTIRQEQELLNEIHKLYGNCIGSTLYKISLD
ncbi:hypothetical protein BB559_004604 [Furculomyces boomerangus]|uniref:Uncharacterized protein n=1 Tax=Furculomyces boomerangus TaxID=61424 RepID=A0A2T9YDR2_9FUNG|nr:hypothetical protein BB559_004604 [Furculomyces boomerangus]